MPSQKKSVSASVSGSTTQQCEESCKVMPKKRGRRPKDKSYTVISNYKEVPLEIEDDNIILHLPGDDKINSDNYNDRRNFLKFFRKNMLGIRQELYEEFKTYIDDPSFDLYFRAAISTYETGGYV